MTEIENQRLELSSELAGFEARLAQMGPTIPVERLERMKAAGLLALCRQTLRCRDPLAGGLLAETIVKSGEERVSLSLKQYVRQVKIAAILTGFCLGVVAGAVGIVVLTSALARPIPPRTESVPNTISARDAIWSPQTEVRFLRAVGENVPLIYEGDKP